MIECTRYLTLKDNSELMCYRCGGGASVLWVLVEDGDTDDEQYVCEPCARAVISGEPLGRLRIGKVPDAKS